MNIIIFFLCAAVTLVCISLEKTYRAVPAKELKRRAREGDQVAGLLFKAVGYGYSLQVVLRILIAVSAAGFFLVSDWLFDTWFALLISAVLIWLGFFWLPEGRVSGIGQQVAARIAPGLAWMLGYVHPVIDRCIAFVMRHRKLHIHTGLYDKADLVDLLEQQRAQADSRIGKTEIDIAVHALTFGDKIARDVLTPRRVVRTVKADEPVGPVLLAELHATGFSRFPVHDDASDAIVGTLYLRDLTAAKAGGVVRAHMRAADICYIHEEQPLTEVLQAILKTRRHLMIVVNSFEEYVGIITIEDVLEQIVGDAIVDEFDQYDDMRAVAARIAAKDHKNHTDHAQTSTEVV